VKIGNLLLLPLRGPSQLQGELAGCCAACWPLPPLFYPVPLLLQITANVNLEYAILNQ
jgi:hypothetical protein